MLKVHLTIALAVLSVGLFGCAKKQTLKQEPAVKQTEAAQPPIQTKEEKPEAKLETQIIYFDFDSHELRSDAKNTLNRASAQLRSNVKIALSIEGHCDERGTTEYNLALGEKRAVAVKDYLVNSGLDKSRLQTVSFGEEKPAAAGHDEQSWTKNRRAEIKVK